MKQILTLLFLILLMGLAPQVWAQKNNTKSKPGTGQDVIDNKIDNMSYWMKMASKGLVPYNPFVPIPPATFKGTTLQTKDFIADSPDIPVTTISATTQSENSVFVDPDNSLYILNSNNSTDWSGGSASSVYGADYFKSSDGAATFSGSITGAGGSNSGDPTTAINHAGRKFVNYIDDPGGQGVAYSDNDGSTWSTATIAPNPGSLADKNHMWIDNSLSSPFQNNLYAAWTDFGGSYNYQVVFSRSTDNGATWSTRTQISSSSSPFSHGVNLQTGPNGEVYACWATYSSTSTLTEDAIGFNKSLNGGQSFGTPTSIITNTKGIRGTGVLKSMRVNSFPVMAVDISGGPYNGNLYVIWTNIGVPGVNTGTNKSVYMIRSSDQGATWSTPVRVNQGPMVDGKEAYCPWITCDPETGALAVVFYDDRNTASTACETWVSYSLDAGTTWSDFRVSDVSFTPVPIPGLASSYMGDYLGITSKGGRVYPCWTDNRDGTYKTYVSPFIIGLNASFTANDRTVCTGSGVTFTSTSSGPPTSWNWSFPGGSPSSFVGETPPAITYSTPGTYDVQLIVGDGITTDTSLMTGYITVADVFADFTASPATVVIGNTVTFTDASSCTPTSWTWSFPGGIPSSYSGPTPPAILYETEGMYDVTLTVTKGTSSSTETKTGFINVIPPEFPMANGSITTCMGNFYDSGGASGSYGNSLNLTETFYPSTAGAMMRMNFSSFSTESGYDYLRIYDGTSTSATLIGTYNGTTGPGTVTANNASGALTFNFTSDGSVTSTGWVAAISCYFNTDPPIVAFTASSTAPAINSTVTLTDQSLNTPTAWSWSITPNTFTYTAGTNANSQNPQVIFTAQGLYTIALTATNANGSTTLTKNDYINCGPPEYVIINGSATVCSGNFYDSGGASGSYQSNEDLTMTFYPETSGAMIKFVFSSFSTESGYDYLRIYNGTSTSDPLIGTYNGSAGPGTVQASNASGALTFNFTSDGSVVSTGWTAAISCSLANSAPVADFTASSVVPPINTTVTFTDQSLNIPTSWLWSISPASYTFTGGTTASSQNPQVQFNATGLYTVSLTATNSYGSNTIVKTDFINAIIASYCTPTYSTGTGYGDYITLVQLGTIDNATGASATPYYTYYSSMSTDLMPNTAYTITLSPGTYSSGNNISVWIDYNANGTFETSEKLGNVVAPPTPATSTISFTVPAAATPGTTRMRVREVYNNSTIDPCSSYTYGETEDYNINILSTDKNLSLTLLLEGLYNGTGLNMAQNENGPQFSGNVADQVTLELHNASAPYTLAGGPYTVNINTDGTAQLTIPGIMSSSYFIVVKHRNSVETWNGTPLSFSGATVSYNFSTAASQAYGDNMKEISGHYVIYTGDANQDGIIDSGDMIMVDNDVANFITGYVVTDMNGDGVIDSGDMIMLDNNAANFIGTIKP